MLGCMTSPFIKTEKRVKLDFQIWIKMDNSMWFKAPLDIVAERTLLTAGCESKPPVLPESVKQPV